MYTWEYDASVEIWSHDLFETKKECIEDARQNYKVKGSIAIGEAVQYKVYANISDLLERIEEDAYEECGEIAYDGNISCNKNRKKEFYELENNILAAVNKYLDSIKEQPSFYKIKNIETVSIE